MTAQGGDLLAWLESTIARREQMAQQTAADFGPEWAVDEGMESVRSNTGADVLDEPGAPHAYVAANDPESVLRRCAADRKLIAAYRKAIGPQSFHTDDPRINGHRDGLMSGLLLAVRAIAQGYGWTGDER